MLNFFKKSKENVAEINTKTELIILTVQKGKTLLNAALQSGIDWPPQVQSSQLRHLQMLDSIRTHKTANRF